MGLESAPQNPLGRIDVNSLAPDAAPVVEPRAVMAMNEAYRQGLITANDIHDRMIQRPVVEGQAKIMGNPEVLAAQKQMILSQPAAQQADMVLKMAQAHAALQKSAVPDILKKQIDELGQAGEVVLPVNGQNYTGDDFGPVQEKWQNLQTYRNLVASNKAERELLKEQTFEGPNGAKSVSSKAAGSQRLADPTAVAASEDWAVTNPSFTAWQANGGQAPTRIFPAPGQTSAPVPQDAPMRELDGSLFSGVTPQVAPKPAQQAAGQATSALPGLQIAAPGVNPGRAPSENAGKAALASERMTQFEQINRDLTENGFNPTTIGNYFQNLLLVGPLEALKSNELKAYNSAASAWAQGILRLESGAAISSKEQSWYEKTFLPQVGDGPTVLAQKADLRTGIAGVVNSIANGQTFDRDAWLELRGQGEHLNKQKEADNSYGMWESDGVTYQESRDPVTGKLLLIPTQNPGVSGASNYTQPARIPTGSVKVEPK